MKYLFAICMLMICNITTAGSFGDTTLTKREMHCLYLNAYFEGNNDSVIAQQGIIEVVLNRRAQARKKHKHLDACSIIYKRHAFSWTKTKHNIPQSQQHVFQLTKLIVDAITTAMHTNQIKPLTFGATYYHAYYVKPCWLPDMKYVNKLGKHLFYKQTDTRTNSCINQSTTKQMYASQYSRPGDPLLKLIEHKSICQYCTVSTHPVSLQDPIEKLINTKQPLYVVTAY